MSLLPERQTKFVANAYPLEMGKAGPSADGEAPLGVLDYLGIIWKFRWPFLLALGVMLTLSLLLTLRTNPTYRATLRLEVQDLNQNFMNVRDLDPAGESNPASPDSYIQVQAQTLQSEALLNRVVDRLRLDQRLGYTKQSVTAARKWAEKLHIESLIRWVGNPQLAAVLRKAFNLPAPELETARVRALEVAASNLKVKAAAQSSVLEIFYTAPDPKLPAEFLNALAEEYVAFTMESRWAGTERTATWLNARLDDMRRNLQDSEQKLEAYAQRSGMVNSNDRESIPEARLRQIQSDWSKAQADLMEIQAKYERANNSSVSELPAVLDDMVLREYATRLADLEKERSLLSVTMRPEHQQLRAVQAQIDTIQGLIKSETANVLGRMRNEYDSAKRREALLGIAYQEQNRRVSDEAGASVRYRVLQREVESKRQFYQDMLQKVNAAGVATAIRSSNIRVIDPAKLQILPYRPDPALNLAIGAVLGVLLGVALCFLLEASERRSLKLRRPGDAHRYLQLREFGTIPNIKTPHVRKSWLGTGKVDSVQPAPQSTALNDSFHGALDALLYQMNEAQAPKVVAVVSAIPQEGKTTLAASLGLALADLQKRVLIVDADMRNPSMSQHFHLGPGPGLTALLSAQSIKIEQMNQLIQPTVEKNVSILPCGETPASIARLLAAGHLREILSVLRDRYDIVLIDTAPVLLFPETRMIGRNADGVVLVTRSNKTSVDVHRQAVKVLAESGSKILGTILNDCDEPVRAGASRYYENVNS